VTAACQTAADVYETALINNFAVKEKTLMLKIQHFIKSVEVFLCRHKHIVEKTLKKCKIAVFKCNITVNENLLNITLYKISFSFSTATSQLFSVILQLIYIDNSFF